jgi:hypothetical protein
MHIPAYKKWYKKSDKELYLDNSAFEYQFLNTKFDINYFYRIIEELQPDIVIVPDVLDNCHETIQNADNFLYDKSFKYMGVCQGKTFKELEESYDYFYQNNFDIIAIPFHSEAYQKYALEKSVNDCYGRFEFIRGLLHKEKVKENFLHLIGLSLPKEGLLYSKYMKKFIKSIDSANPIKYAFVDGKYKDIRNINSKPHYILDEKNILKETPKNTLSDILYNIKEFQKIWK